MSDRRTLKVLEGRLERVRNLYKWGDIGEVEFLRDKAGIEAEIAQLKSLPSLPTIRQSSQRITDVVAAWKDATPDQRARLVASILSEIQVKDRTVVAVRPCPGTVQISCSALFRFPAHQQILPLAA